MALPTSGPLTLQNIQTEFGGINPISLNEYYAGGGLVPAGTSGTNGAVPTGNTISINNFYGTANLLQLVVSLNTQNFNLLTAAQAAGFVNGSSRPIQVTINANVYVWSDNTTLAAFDTGAITGSGTITIINNGYIIGKGGAAATTTTSASITSEAGGNAINIQKSVTIINNSGAFIAGGGGGGGTGRLGTNSIYALGGGGAGGGASGTNAGGAIGIAGVPATSTQTSGGQVTTNGGSGGRILSGVGGASISLFIPISAGGTLKRIGLGGGSGGSGSAMTGGPTQSAKVAGSGAGGTAGAVGGNGGGSSSSGSETAAGGGGGGWGAAGGSGFNSAGGTSLSWGVGGAGGKAVNLNGFTGPITGAGTVYGVST